MNTVMVESWKKSDCFTKAIFKELAEDGKQEYRRQLEVYYANRTSYIMPAVVNPEPKTPVAVCSVPCNTTSNIKESLQGLDMDLMAPIPFASLPFIGDQKQNIASSAPKNIISSNIRAEVPSPSSPMSSVSFTNGTFKLHEVSPDTSQVRSFNGGNFYGNASCRFAESAYPQGLLPRRVTYNTSGQYQNTVAYSNDTSTQDNSMPMNKEFDDDFMDMINKTLKY